MSDETPIAATEEQLSFWNEHRFLILIIGTLVISIVLVCVSIAIYKFSGSAQLDLSRPGYQSVSNKVDRTDPVTDYSAFGPVNKDTVNDFTKIYDTQAAKAKAVDAFNGDPLNPDVLEFGDPTTSNE
ncbi:MAG TPA: hypothetical protein VIM31_04755 [Candidatus Microsaccharimonas sp.]|jgi:hypothetical protein